MGQGGVTSATADSPPAPDSERRARIDLAACYRLVALFGWDDIIATHISLRLPGHHDRFLINPFGMTFEEITASSLVVVDTAGEAVGVSDYGVNPAGFTIHSAIHMARHDADCVLHLHTVDGVAVSSLVEGLLPLNQTAMLAMGSVAYHEYEGVAVDLDERERLQRDLGERHALILRNHGTLAVGRTAAEAFLRMYFLERACTMQVRTLGMNRAINAAPDQAVERTVGMAKDMGPYSLLAWPALLRRLDRKLPGYAD